MKYVQEYIYSLLFEPPCIHFIHRKVANNSKNVQQQKNRQNVIHFL